MPRNVEYLLDRYIEECNLEQFILTYSIAIGIFPPEHVLNKFGKGYGMDNEIQNIEALFTHKAGLEKELQELPSGFELDISNLMVEIEKKHKHELWNYHQYSTEYRAEVQKLNRLIEKVDKLSIKNNLQSKFINLVTDFFIERKKELDELYKAKLITPVKETMDIAEKRLKLEFKTKIDDLKSSINSVETQIIFNNEFFEEIAEEWLGKVKTERGQILFNQLRDGDESVINELIELQMDWVKGFSNGLTSDIDLINDLNNIGKRQLIDLANRELNSKDQEIFFRYGAYNVKNSIEKYYYMKK